jgi:hypothetical protein
MTQKPTLDELANHYSTDKGTKYPHGSVHGYAPLYDPYLTPWREKPIRMLEIGICMEGTEGAHSVKMWDSYFDNASIYTFDIVDMSKHPFIQEKSNVSFYRGDQSNRDDYKKMYGLFGNEEFDFILEDGSHVHEHQIISLGHLFQYVKSGGYYILEDISIPGHPVCCIRNDETYGILQEFKETGKINSPYLLPEEKEYLENNVTQIDIHPDIQDAYVTAIFYKK